MPTGIPYIISNEAAERFSFYGMKGILAIFLTQYLFLLDGSAGKPMDASRSTEFVHLFNGAFYLTPFIGAILADVFFGKYRVIMVLSLVYCAGHAALALMGRFGNSEYWMISGLVLIALGSGGIKPCVSAHVGDQFGANNARLLPRIFNWFYFSINLGAFASGLLSPWLLQWYGPHWAFGVPGVLMAIATWVFWLGRHRFAHVPPGGLGFLKEAFGKDGLLAIAKLVPVYFFVAIFWALFDQTSSTWIFQSQEMDRNFLGITWLPSQIQALNPIFVLSFIPIFSFIIYPFVGKYWTLTPLRKMGVGFIFITASFVLVSLIQTWIDAGERPNIVWQIAAFAMITAAEIMISIVALEFAYTQAPRKMKSFIMCFYLAAVAVGNFLVVGVNHYIRVSSAAEEQFEQATESLPEDWRADPRTAVLPGYDKSDENEVFIRRLSKDAKLPLEVPGQETLDRAANTIISVTTDAKGNFPDKTAGNRLISGLKDYWGKPLQYLIISSTSAKIWSAGGDGKWNTKWDVGIIIEKKDSAVEKGKNGSSLHPELPWLALRKKELGIEDRAVGESFSKTTFSGGQVRLQGASYFWFFTGIMGAAAILFIPFAIIYKPKSYLQN